MITANSIELADVTAATTGIQQGPQRPTIKLNGRLILANETAKNGRIELVAGEVAVDANNLIIKGKHLSRLETDMYYDAERRNWSSKGFIADFYDGRMTGKLELSHCKETGWEYALQTGFEDVDLKKFLTDRPKKTSDGDGTRGKMNGSLNIGGTVGESWPRIGRCRLRINEMQVSKLSPLAKLLGVLKLQEASDFDFERMFVDSYIRYNGLSIEKFDLSGRTVAFNGSGRMDLQSQNVNMTLSARGKRLAGAEPSVLQSLTEGLGQAVVRVEVSGNVYDPQVTTKPLPVLRDSLEILGTKQTE